MSKSTIEGQRLKQIGGWVAKDEGETLKAYALVHNIDLCGLGSILIAREINLGRLGILKTKYEKTIPASNRFRFTVHAKSDAFAIKFKDHASRFRMSTNNAVGLILRAELSERWLTKACVSDMEST